MHSFLRRFGFVVALSVVAGLVALPEARSDYPTHYVVTRNRGELAAAGFSAVTAGTAHTIVTTTIPSAIVAIENTTNVELMVTKGGVDFKRMPAGSFRVFDLKGNTVAFSAGVWGAYEIGNPATGVLEIIAVPVR